MIRKPLTALGILAATALTAAPASAYWEYGHETVAQIAYANVAPRTKVAIRRILAQQALLDTPECPAGTIEEASVWADCIKPLKTATASRASALRTAGITRMSMSARRST